MNVRANVGSKILLLLCIGLVSLPLSGCWDRKEINDLALVTAAGIDKTDDGAVELSVQVYIPRMAGGNQMEQTSRSGGGGGAQTLVRTATGRTASEAMARLQEKFSRKIFWGHTDVYIFGEKAAREGIGELVDFILRFPQPREKANVFVCEGEAKEILALLPPLERNLAEVLRELSQSRIGLSITVKELTEMLVGEAGNAALPMLEVLPPSAGTEELSTIAYVSGTAVFRKDKMVGRINDQKTRGLLWLRDEIKYAVVTVSPEESDGFVSMYLLRSKTELIPRIEGDKWSMTVKIQTEDDIMENTTRLNMMEPKVIQKLEEDMRQEIVKRVKMTLDQVQKEMKADVIGFADAFHRKYPREWRKMKDNWDEMFPKVVVHVEAEAKIMRPGNVGPIVNRPKEEMMKQ